LEDAVKREIQRFTVGDVIRMPHYPTCGGFRCWKVIGEHLGGVKQEGTYELLPLDVVGNEAVHVPCLMLETHPEIVRV
jgi:hypothetical protein